MKQKVRLSQYIKSHGSMTSMLVLVVLVGMGEKMAERFLPLYLLALGGGAWAVGALNALDNLLGALYSLPGGYVSDRLGYKRSLMLFTSIAMVGYAVVIVFPYWQAVLAGSVLFISWTAVSLPAIMSLVAKSVPRNRRTMGVSLHSFVRRIPMALGPLVGGLLIGIYGSELGIRVAFVVALFMGSVALVVIQTFMQDPLQASGATPRKEKAKAGDMFKPALRKLLLSDILIRFAEQIPYAFVVVWVVEKQGLSAFQFGLLTTIEMVTALLVYIPVSYMADLYGKKRFVVITFCFFTLFPVFLMISNSFAMFVVAFIIRGLKEFGEPTRKALIMDLAPEEWKAQTFGAYYLIRDGIVSIAALSSAWLWMIGPKVNFLVATGFGILGTLVFAMFGTDQQGVQSNKDR